MAASRDVITVTNTLSTSKILTAVGLHKHPQLKIQTISLPPKDSSEPDSLKVNYNGDNLKDFDDLESPDAPHPQKPLTRVRTY